MTEVVLILLAYLLGSIPTAVWVGRYYFDIDIREHGSGNSGATNTFRVLGKKHGILVLLVDLLKGLLAVKLLYVFDYQSTVENMMTMQIALGIASLIGHIFPIWAEFRGGKGIATLLGMIIAINPLVALSLVIVFLIILNITHYVSLSSMIAGVVFPLLIWFVLNDAPTALKIFGIATSILVIFTHQKNIHRLLAGNESKIYLFKKKK